MDHSVDPVKLSARLALDASMRRWSTPLPNPEILDTTIFFPAEMGMIPERVAKEGWLLWLGNDLRKLGRVLHWQAHLETLRRDWVAGSLHQPRSHFPDRADATAYYCLTQLIQNNEVFLAIIPTRSWAYRDSQVGLNRSVLRAAGVKTRLPKWTGGYDGLVCVDGSLPMTQVFSSNDQTPSGITPAFNAEEEELDWFPLEVGSCSMAKSVAMLVLHGRLDRKSVV